MNYASDTYTEGNAMVSNDLSKLFKSFINQNFEHFLALKVDFT